MIEKIKDLEGRLATIEESMKNVLRAGTVSNRDEARCRCRVQFRDNDELISYWCQVIMKKSHKDKEYWLPDVGELVLCVFLPFGHEQGFIVGAVYNALDDKPEDANKDRYVLEDESGNQWLMDRKCNKARLTTKEYHIFGDLIVHGKIFDEKGTITNHTNEGLHRDTSGPAPEWICK